MITKTDFDAKLSSLKRKTTAKDTKNFVVENELDKLKTFDSSSFIVKTHFEEGGTQSCLVFQPINKYFKVIASTDYVSSWKSKGLSAETIKLPTTSGNSLTPAVSWHQNKSKICWKLFKTTENFIHWKSSKYLHCL